MPALILQIISYISLAIQAAPKIVQVYEDGKALVDSLFSGGLITADQQKVIKDWADAHQAATLAGETPPEFLVDP